jgi:hypothetical protein
MGCREVQRGDQHRGAQERQEVCRAVHASAACGLGVRACVQLPTARVPLWVCG